MFSESGASSKHEARSGLRSMLRVMAVMALRRSSIMLLCLLGSGAAEGIGIASLIPLIVIAGDSSAAAGIGNKSRIASNVTDALHSLGLATEPLHLLFVLVFALLGKAILTLLAMRQVGHAVAEVGTRMRMNLISALLDARWEFFVREPIGRFANALGMEALRASEAYSACAQFLSHGIQALVYLGITALFSWKLALCAAGIGALMMLCLNRFIIGTRRQARKQTRQTKIVVTRLADVLLGLKPMKAMGRHVRFGALFSRDIQAIDKAMRRQLFAKHANRVLQEPIVLLCVGVGIYVALTIATIPLAELIAMSLLLVKTVTVNGRVREDLQAVNMAENGYWAIHSAIEDARTAREESRAGRAPTLVRGIEIRNVSMAFGRKCVLDNVSFEIPAGQVTAIVGASGAGKTTLVDLILGLYEPSSGNILADGVPLAKLDIMKWRSMVGYVPQELILFHDTIMANISLGDPAFSREDVERALRQSGAWDFVAQMSEGVYHVVGERGATLSGGQRQRIALARALIDKPRLLILDEATSALDPATGAQIVSNVRELASRDGITVVSISHQAAWITVADKVIRIQAGGISETFPKVANQTER
jgi:ATP-binding cassette, subfamily C, bacterial